jgi:hypothetical protein
VIYSEFRVAVGSRVRAVSSVVEHRLYTPAVTGSNPVPPTSLCSPRRVCGIHVRGSDTRVRENVVQEQLIPADAARCARGTGS